MQNQLISKERRRGTKKMGKGHNLRKRCFKCQKLTTLNSLNGHEHCNDMNEISENVKKLDENQDEIELEKRSNNNEKIC